MIRQIKAQIRKLPSLSIPPEDCVIVLEVDGCMEGWGEVVSVHPEEEDSDAIYSISEGIDDTEQIGGSIETKSSVIIS